MAVEDECVKHAALSLVGSYVLDYLPSRDLLARTNWHYRKAKELVSLRLKQPETFEVGHGDSLIAAVLLLVIDDVSISCYFVYLWLISSTANQLGVTEAKGRSTKLVTRRTTREKGA
jgi:hypothetical protein